MEAALSSDEFRVRQIVPGESTRSIGANRYMVDLASPEAVGALHAMVRGEQDSRVGAVINFMGLSEPFHQVGPSDHALPLAEGLFHVLRRFEADLRASAKQGGGWVYNFTSLGGKFGLDGGKELPLAQTGTLGMCKSVGKEWPGVRVKNIDLDPDMDPQMLFAQVAQEIVCDDGLTEVGFSGNERWTVQLVDVPADHSAREPLSLDADSVVLITGGAYGVTADAALHLARRAQPRLVLVGRSPLEQEPEDTRGLADAAALRHHFIQRMRQQGAAMTPAKIERAVQRLLKTRRIHANIAAMRQAGSEVEYHAVSVTDAEQFGQLIDDLYGRFGRIDGVIHGAGVIEDSLLAKKTTESFARVFRTKADGANVLAERLRPEGLKFLVFFSSVSGRFGNAGQIDYSAANEYLNKLAVHLDAQWPGRVVAINWGPWDAGMISEELRRLYRARGIELIPIEAGAEALIAELRMPQANEPEVTIACGIQAIAEIGK